MQQGSGTGNAESLLKQNIVEEATILVMLSPACQVASKIFMTSSTVSEEIWGIASRNSSFVCLLIVPVPLLVAQSIPPVVIQYRLCAAGSHSASVSCNWLHLPTTTPKTLTTVMGLSPYPSLFCRGDYQRCIDIRSCWTGEKIFTKLRKT